MAIDYIERVLYRAENSSDVINLVKDGKIKQVLEAERKINFIKALEDCERRIYRFKRLAKFGSLKALIFASLGGLLGYYFKGGITTGLQNLATHRVFAPCLIGAVLGYTINNTLDLGLFSLFFPKNFSTSECRNILIDFFSCLNLASDEEEGYYATPSQIIDIIKTERANIYKEWEILEFLDKQPYKVEKQGKYLVTTEIDR